MDCGTAYCTMADFGGTGIIPLLKSIVNAIPSFFAIFIFSVWTFATAGSYFAILKTTGKKRFWHAITALSFICFLLSLIIVAMNEANFTYLNGYWVGFYILMSCGSWYMLANYK